MKKLFLACCMALIGASMWAQDPVITFSKTTHDFGTINEADGRVTTVFEFKNEGMSPLVLSNVRASCGCTTPDWSKAPVEPGQVGHITVTYNPNGRPGKFQKTVTITSNATEQVTRVYIKGEVIPKTSKSVDNFPVKIAGVGLQSKGVGFGNVKAGDAANRIILMRNENAEKVTVKVLVEKAPGLTVTTDVATLEPKASAQLRFDLDSKMALQYGPLNYNVYLVVNGAVVKDEAHRINVQADITEDFSKLTAEQLKSAPIAEVISEVKLGVVPTGKIYKFNIGVKNCGRDALVVRRIVSKDETIACAVANKSIKSGKNITNIKADLRTAGMKPGNYTRELVVITNDPKSPRRVVKVSWTIQ